MKCIYVEMISYKYWNLLHNPIRFNIKVDGQLEKDLTDNFQKMNIILHSKFDENDSNCWLELLTDQNILNENVSNHW